MQAPACFTWRRSEKQGLAFLAQWCHGAMEKEEG